MSLLKGLVVSDLHLLASRSEGELRLRELAPRIEAMDILVLNGDTFDFKWSSVSDPLLRASDFLSAFLARFPRLRIYFVQGNHDSFGPLSDVLNETALREPRFTVHPDHLKLGGKLFIHGDACHRPMTHADLRESREKYRDPKRPGLALKLLHSAIINTRLHRVACMIQSPAKVARNILYYLQSSDPNALECVTDIYLGHTHAPFTAFEYGGFRWHNSGSAIRFLPFFPLEFLLEESSPRP